MTFNVEDVYQGALERLRAHIRYSATVWLTTEATSVSYLTATHPFVVYTPAAAITPERPISESRSETVRLLCCLRRGVCEIKASCDKNIHVAGDTLQLQLQICNQRAALAIRWVCVELLEELTLMDVGERSGMRISRVVSTQQLPGVAAGYNSEIQSVALRLAAYSNAAIASGVVLEEVAGPLTAPLHPLNASTTSQHFASTHLVRVSCKPVGCRPLVLDVPLLILHAAAGRATSVSAAFSRQVVSGGERTATTAL